MGVWPHHEIWNYCDFSRTLWSRKLWMILFHSVLLWISTVFSKMKSNMKLLIQSKRYSDKRTECDKIATITKNTFMSRCRNIREFSCNIRNLTTSKSTDIAQLTPIQCQNQYTTDMPVNISFRWSFFNMIWWAMEYDNVFTDKRTNLKLPQIWAYPRTLLGVVEVTLTRKNLVQVSYYVNFLWLRIIKSESKHWIEG
jgi:hypothetical protein